jgi:hypothetical protein
MKRAALIFFCLTFAGCLGGAKALKVVDFTEQRVTDLTIVKKVAGKREFFFFSTVKMGLYLEGNIQGMITDYAGNPIEGVPIKAVSETGRQKTVEGIVEGVESLEAASERNTASAVGLNFLPGITDSMGLYKIHFSIPISNDIVDITGKLVYNPGWDQQKINLGKAYEPQQKETPFRLYYNMDTGFLVFAEGIRKVIVEPVGEGQGKMKALPGAKAPGAVPSATTPASPATGTAPTTAPATGKEEEDLFKGFNFGE